MCPWVGVAVIAAGAIMSAVSSIQQGQAQSRALNYNAQIAENNALAAQYQAQEQENRTRDEGRRLLGAQTAAFGASGAALEGTPVDVLGSAAGDIELDALTARYAGTVEAMNFRAQAASLRSRASSARTQGFLGAGTSLLMGAGRAFGGGAGGGGLSFS